MFGRIFHLLVDAMLVSVALSGIKRSTGLTPAVSRMPNKDLRNLMRIYLEAGEWVGSLAYSMTLDAHLDRVADNCSCLASFRIPAGHGLFGRDPGPIELLRASPLSSTMTCSPRSIDHRYPALHITWSRCPCSQLGSPLAFSGTER